MKSKVSKLDVFLKKVDTPWGMSNNMTIVGVDFSIDGLLDEINKLQKENERLKDQNKTLTDIATLNSNEVARLDKELKGSVKLPKPFIEEGCYDGKTKIYQVYQSTVETVCDISEDTFDTMEEAEARLKELQGEAK